MEILKALKIDQINLRSDGTIAYAGKEKAGLVPVIGAALLGADEHIYINEYHAGWLKIYSADPNAFALEVKGDSMYPRIKAGEFVLVEPNASVSNGDEVFLRTTSDVNMIKQLGYHKNNIFSLSV